MQSDQGQSGKSVTVLLVILWTIRPLTEEESIGSPYNYIDIEPGSDEWENKRLLFGEPYIRLTPTIYKCYHCREFFNHDRMRIICKRGIFKENKVECRNASPVLQDLCPQATFLKMRGSQQTDIIIYAKKDVPNATEKSELSIQVLPGRFHS